MTYQAKGLQAWFFQRVSGVFIALYILYFLWVFFTTELFTYQLWLTWFSHPLMNAATGLFFIQLVVHAWVGMRDVVLDYMPNNTIRFFSLIVISFILIASSLEILRILFSLSLNA
ncbi:MAG: succinate dehydrogenase, hydrophobic membrane anchor protein [gamma proteobacterium symbiont of Lucinoma myriamae]|nr:succinate dehydrogenase, hydrophobic membrane anchor protein [gamma proteobacterium symbiont of Lucinoma myriamae]MCU7817828.1 succinate dehydrogenase, hydrophobic membrane anchor protein [gamma proteobacterium symbiont of Lucinoma myriamae]MCU7832177.1 succinate dehydrogenase, hydrophobic membrane anchor protein [gamma proteobacterium symbiont of Lucinoma myriamae]